MIWKVCESYPDYEVSEAGDVRRLTSRTCAKAGYVLRPWLRCGYPCVNIGNKFVSVHRLVATAYLPSDPGRTEVNHKNGIRTDNRVENLEWATRKENAQHAHDTWLQDCRGEKNGQAKLTPEQVMEIRSVTNPGGNPYGTAARLARKYGVSARAVSHVIRRERWTHLGDTHLNAASVCGNT
jgi:hypothetical protein